MVRPWLHRRTALGADQHARLLVTTAPPLSVRIWVAGRHEPAGAVIRAGAVAEPVRVPGYWTRTSAYLTNDRLAAHPLRPHSRFTNSSRSTSRRCVPGCGRRHRVSSRSRSVASMSTLQSYVGGWRLGPNSATLVISRTPVGAIAAIVERV